MKPTSTWVSTLHDYNYIMLHDNYWSYCCYWNITQQQQLPLLTILLLLVIFMLLLSSPAPVLSFFMLCPTFQPSHLILFSLSKYIVVFSYSTLTCHSLTSSMIYSLSLSIWLTSYLISPNQSLLVIICPHPRWFTFSLPVQITWLLFISSCRCNQWYHSSP